MLPTEGPVNITWSMPRKGLYWGTGKPGTVAEGRTWTVWNAHEINHSRRRGRTDWYSTYGHLSAADLENWRGPVIGNGTPTLKWAKSQCEPDTEAKLRDGETRVRWYPIPHDAHIRSWLEYRALNSPTASGRAAAVLSISDDDGLRYYLALATLQKIHEDGLAT